MTQQGAIQTFRGECSWSLRFAVCAGEILRRGEREGRQMAHIDGDNYTAYGQESASKPSVGVPWPDSAEKRIAALERESDEHTEEIATVDAKLTVLRVRLNSLERITHRLLNAGTTEEAE
jgi:hypothetical protein